jgi:ribosomal protein S3
LAVERQVISSNIKKVKVKEFLSKELEKAGIGEIDIQRTPMDTRVGRLWILGLLFMPRDPES